jgi:RNA polymerase II subunit A C-terminal domain phosphatase
VNDYHVTRLPLQRHPNTIATVVQMRLSTPDSLAYPITVTRVPRAEQDDIEQGAVLFSYRYKDTYNVWDEDLRENVDKEFDRYADFESEVDGKIIELQVQPGQVMTGKTPVAEIEEACAHEVQFGGICAACGKDMTQVQYNSTIRNTERATINAVHRHTALLVSQEEAERAHLDTRKRLLSSRRLSLVVDLDQTVIQATVDPTVGEWQQDPSNPNYEAVKDVQKFELKDNGPGGRSTWYYIKLRPGLHDFLKTISQHYELHIYTMATRQYATEIARLIDKDGKFFGERILSRDENGSLHVKSLKRIFPLDTKMVVIIDDRGDVWQWSPNLVKVTAYDFFTGVGDINSAFLPKRPELANAGPRPKKMEKAAENDEGSNTSGSESKSEGDNSEPSPASTPASTPPLVNGEALAADPIAPTADDEDGEVAISPEKIKERDETIAEQLADRPLLQKQKILDAAEEEAKASPAAEAALELLSENGDKKDGEHPKYRHNLLQDDDDDLLYIEQVLKSIHQNYFDQYEKGNAGSKGGRVAQLKPGSSKKRSIDALQEIPDVAEIMPRMKSKVLAGVHIVFSGVVPLGTDIQSCDLAVCAKSFGASVSANISKKTTHVVGNKDRRTAKVRQAAKRGGRIAIVNHFWLWECFTQWKKVPEDPFRIHSDAQPNGTGSKLPDSFDDKGYVLSSSDEEAAQTEDETDAGTETPNGTGDGIRGDGDNDTDTELEKYGPSAGRRNSGPVEGEQEEDWGAIMGELDEFIGSEAEEETETESETTLKTPPSQRKRKRDATTDDVNDGDIGGEDIDGESRLQKRKKEALARTSSLTNVATATSEDGLTPADADVDGDPGGVIAEDVAEEDQEDLDLEAALAAEMERQASEEEGEAA